MAVAAAPVPVELLEAVRVEVSNKVSRVTVFVIVEVCVMVVVPAWARARRGRRAAERMLVSCIVAAGVVWVGGGGGGGWLVRVNPR